MFKNKYTFSLFFVCTVIFLASCSSKKYYSIRSNQIQSSVKEENFLLVRPLLASELAGYKKTEIAFENNAFVGFIHFSGGLIRVQKAFGVQVESKNKEFKGQTELKPMVLNWLEKSLSEVLRTKNKPIKIVTIKQPFSKVNTVKNYELSPDNGQDNINVPNIHFVFEEASKEFNQVLEVENVRFAVVPIVQQYYAHSGGWFNGQDWGCLAGIRTGIQMLVYDSKEKRIVFDSFVSRKWVVHGRSGVNENEYHNEFLKIQKLIDQDFQKLLD
ncbi:hypothetical protein [Leptospira stimsonii]|uniref:Lipoprotein n=1 Tax=Leptospira stimsonii TaxID=2202203 RepID=A0A396Z3D3_9LEPT|nr:hypothetical protein [Leptospira stimsonii]RHX90032.1 hypothetical protein DLM75_13975 [Leptospira stimsonii]